MKRTCHSGLWQAALWMIVGIFVSSAMACEFDVSGVPLTDKHYSCVAQVWYCPPTVLPLDMTLSAPSQYTQISHYAKQKNLWANKAQSTKPIGMWRNGSKR